MRSPNRPAVAAEDLAWLGAIAGTITLAAVFALLAPELAKLFPSPSHSPFRVWTAEVNPEPLEDVRAMLAIAAPFALGAIVLALGARKPNRPSLDPLIVAAQAIGLAALVVCVLRQPSTFPFLPSDYFDRYLLSAPNLIAGVCIGIAITAVILRWTGPPPRLVARLRPLAGRGALVLALAVLLTIVFLLPAVITDATVGRSGILAHSSVALHAEDYWAVVNGRTPLVNYIGEYSNLLPFAVAPAPGLCSTPRSRRSRS